MSSNGTTAVSIQRLSNLNKHLETSAEMNTAPPAGSALATPAGTAGPTTPKKGPPKFKQRQTRTFKSKAPKPGQKGFGDDIPGMEGLGTDIAVVCPWEAYGDMELSDLAKYGII
ncbi:retinal cone rhodopsin-sensitive cGMP 3',5'-cyclic phosphodiesterase subunit gamma-like isoform X1 [Salvelinus namaycush]|uniref:Retinal cone rhodopsin-sensitive cGMP 3',5'-cyclic phosphodiesterase subunit gamma n=1 Tax=Salvelinus namaycush TaxID=8040 RepID=A0A8U0U5P0_SALNM|nr:retinal cone rhodopsin-sensitive cGMP 3',5'-cyclic phosphodiesterase subunit gamma-like isoform X1 [Salvelinus namaycush]